MFCSRKNTRLREKGKSKQPHNARNGKDSKQQPISKNRRRPNQTRLSPYAEIASHMLSLLLLMPIVAGPKDDHTVPGTVRHPIAMAV